MAKRFGAIVLLVGLLAPLASKPAFAEDANVFIDIDSDPEIISSVAHVTDGDIEVVTVKIYAPRANGDGRFLWQRCKLPYSGSGTYECGIDAESARSNRGRWVAKAYLDGRFGARRPFQV